MTDIKKHIDRLRACGLDTIFFDSDDIIQETYETEEQIDSEGDVVERDMGKEEKMKELMKSVEVCERCDLHKTRNNTVFGEVDVNADIVFVGEAPGADEDRQGRPFVGRAGKLLDKMIEAMNYKRTQVYICNILKCRPPENRNPTTEEIESCTPYLTLQLDIISPKVIVSLGAFATQFLTGKKGSMAKMREGEHYYGKIRLVPTYHPAACLRTPGYKKDVWDDLQLVMKLVEEI